MNKYLAVSLIIVSFIIGLGGGYYLSPSYSEGMQMSTDTKTDQMKVNDDSPFINAMIAHHMGAVKMAEDAVEKSNRTEIKELAQNIITAQEKEIEELYSWKKDWYNNTEKITLNEHSMHTELGNADERYDLRFIDAMIIHHEGAIDMADDALASSSRNEILNFANKVKKDQTTEINQMKAWRTSWYGLNNG